MYSPIAYTFVKANMNVEDLAESISRQMFANIPFEPYRDEETEMRTFYLSRRLLGCSASFIDAGRGGWCSLTVECDPTSPADMHWTMSDSRWSNEVPNRDISCDFSEHLTWELNQLERIEARLSSEVNELSKEGRGLLRSLASKSWDSRPSGIFRPWAHVTMFFAHRSQQYNLDILSNELFGGMPITLNVDEGIGQMEFRVLGCDCRITANERERMFEFQLASDAQLVPGTDLAGNTLPVRIGDFSDYFALMLNYSREIGAIPAESFRI